MGPPKRLQSLLLMGEKKVRDGVPERGGKSQDQASYQARDGEVGPEILHLGLSLVECFFCFFFFKLRSHHWLELFAQ